LFVYKDTRLGVDELIGKLSYYIKSFNSYIEIDKIKDVGVKTLIEIQNTMYNGDMDLIDALILPSDRMFLLYETPEEATRRILFRTITYILLYLNNNKMSIRYIGSMLDQLLIDTFIAKDILKLFPVNTRKFVKLTAEMMSTYEDFQKKLQSHFTKNYNTEMKEVLKDEVFLNSIDDDEKNILYTGTIKNSLDIYFDYIYKSIEVITHARSAGQSVSMIWGDINNYLLREEV
jgi:hypothetical protein